MGTRNKTEKKESAITKNVNKNLVFNVNSSDTNRPVNPAVDNIKSLSRNNSAEERAENDVFPSATAHRLQNAKNVTIGTPLKLENGFVLVFTNHHPKTKIIFLIFYLTSI